MQQHEINPCETGLCLMDSSHYEIFYRFTQRHLPYQPRALSGSEDGVQPRLACGLWIQTSLSEDSAFPP